MAVLVFRGGQTARQLLLETENASIHALDGKPREAVDVRFAITSKGGGMTMLSVQFDPGSFRGLAAAMMKANPNEAVKAFGEALQAGIPTPRPASRP